MAAEITFVVHRPLTEGEFIEVRHLMMDALYEYMAHRKHNPEAYVEDRYDQADERWKKQKIESTQLKFDVANVLRAAYDIRQKEVPNPWEQKNAG